MGTGSNPVLEKSKAFALLIISLYRYLTEEKKEYILSKQLPRSGTSIGANVREAVHGQSKADFAAKMNIALKEANEAEYWLRLLYKTEYLNKAQFESLHRDVQELLGILISICRTSNATK